MPWKQTAQSGQASATPRARLALVTASRPGVSAALPLPRPLRQPHQLDQRRRPSPRRRRRRRESGNRESNNRNADQQGQRSGGQPPSGDYDDDPNGRRRSRDRFRNRNRRRERPGGGGAENEPVIAEDDVLIPIAGILDVLDNYAFVRTTGYLPGPNDVYVSLSQVKRHGLRKGDVIEGAVRQPRDGERREKFNALVRLDKVNGLERPEFS
jgi:transcription termination factor Rho